MFYVEKFIQTVCYSGKEGGSLTEARVRLYKQMNIKASQSLPLDEKLMLQAIKSIHCIKSIYHCSTVDEAIVSDIFCKIMFGLSTIRMNKFVHYGSLVCF